MVAERLLSLLLLAGVAAEAGAWSAAGHEAVCELAWQQLSPEAKSFVRRVRSQAEDALYPTFAQSCAWPDEVRRTTHTATYEYHYLNVERGAFGVDLERDCAAYDCVVVAIRRYATYLEREPSGSRERQRRAEALRFLGHFVGDLHQPLHVSYADDRGGNDLEVEWFGETMNLHQVWDFAILERAGLEGMSAGRTLAAQLSESAAPERPPSEPFDLVAWANESYRSTRTRVYDLPADRRLGAGYYRAALPVARRRLQQAGARLAALLEAAARKQLRFATADG